MSQSRRIGGVVTAVLAAAAVTIVPVGSPEPAHGAEVCRVAEAGEDVNPLGPGALAVDAAFVVDDPDAERFPMEGIRYPDEGALWAGTAMAASVTTAVSAEHDGPAATFTGPERADREVSDSIVRLYCGLFDRLPNPFELEYWAGRYWNGLPLVSIAEAFTTSSEFVARFGLPGDASLAGLLYEFVLDRHASLGEVEHYLGAIEAGEMTRGELVTSFTESPEFVMMTGTVAPEKPPLPYPAVGSGRRIIYADRGQRVWLVEATGELAKTHQVSGRRGVPGTGRYQVYSMSRYAWAPYDGITMEYMVRFARGEWPYGFHSIPVWPDDRPLQTIEQLGTHRSGGCVRQDFSDAEYVFGWAEVGTRVIVVS
jgi:hypothetical protein